MRTNKRRVVRAIGELLNAEKFRANARTWRKLGHEGNARVWLKIARGYLRMARRNLRASGLFPGVRA